MNAASELVIVDMVVRGDAARAAIAPGRSLPAGPGFERFTAHVELMKTATRLFTEAIASGRSASDALDIIIDDPTYGEQWTAYRASISAAATTATGRSVMPADRFSLERMGDAVVAKLLEPASVLLQAIFDASERIGPRLSKMEALTPIDEQRKNILWFMGDPLVPADIAECMLAGARSVVAAHLIDLTTYYGFPAEPVRALAATFVDDLRRYLRLHASLPESGVPESLVPKHERFDVSGLLERQKGVLSALKDLTQVVESK